MLFCGWERMPSTKQLARVIEQAIGRRLRYVLVQFGSKKSPSKVELRVSSVRRRTSLLPPEPSVLDIDVVRITIAKRDRRTGRATKFFCRLARAAKAHGRGAYVENCITEESKGWGAKLALLGLATLTAASMAPNLPHDLLMPCYLSTAAAAANDDADEDDHDAPVVHDDGQDGRGDDEADDNDDDDDEGGDDDDDDGDEEDQDGDGDGDGKNDDDEGGDDDGDD